LSSTSIIFRTASPFNQRGLLEQDPYSDTTIMNLWK